MEHSVHPEAVGHGKVEVDVETATVVQPHGAVTISGKSLVRQMVRYFRALQENNSHTVKDAECRSTTITAPGSGIGIHRHGGRAVPGGWGGTNTGGIRSRRRVIGPAASRAGAVAAKVAGGDRLDGRWAATGVRDARDRHAVFPNTGGTDKAGACDCRATNVCRRDERGRRGASLSGRPCI